MFGSSNRELSRHFASYIRDRVVTCEVSDRAFCISEQHDVSNVCLFHRNTIFLMGICVCCLLQAKWGRLVQSRLRTAFRRREVPPSYSRCVKDTGNWCWCLFLFRSQYFADTPVNPCGSGSVVAIATGYGLDGPGIESLWGGERFSAPVQTGPGTHPASCTVGTGSFPGVKVAGA